MDRADVTPRSFARSAADLDPFLGPNDTSDPRRSDVWRRVVEVAQEMPRLARFVPHRLALVAIGLGCVAVAAQRFNRFSANL